MYRACRREAEKSEGGRTERSSFSVVGFGTSKQAIETHDPK
jgi:hypothetical protein